MATPIYIDNGINIDPTWTNVIGISSDGIIWSTIPKSGLQCLVQQIQLNSSELNDTLNKRQPSYDAITLKNVANEDISLFFKIGNVANQPGWITVQDALTDLNNWISN